MTTYIINTFIRNNNLTDSEQRQKYATVSSIVGIISNIFLSLSKMICGILFSSISILGDGINNLSDSGSSIITLVGFKMSEKPADKEHPFGHARIEYISGFIVSFVIFFIGFQLFLSSFDKILNPTKIETNVLTTVILVFSILIKFWLYTFNKKIGTLINSKAIIGVSKDSFNDIIITLGVLISGGIYYFFNINLDGYVGVLLALLIAKSGFDLARDTLSPIIGEAPKPEFIRGLCEKIMSYDKVLGVHDLVVHTYGEDRHFVSVHVEFDAKLEFLVCHDIADKIEREFEDMGIQVVVHSDPVVTDSKQFNEYKELLTAIIKEIDSSLDLHGFRYVETDHGTNFIFDVVLPCEVNLTAQKLIELICSEVRTFDDKFACIIRVDKHYNTV